MCISGIRDIAVQLNLTLAMDRCDIASSCIFVESRKPELRVSITLERTKSANINLTHDNIVSRMTHMICEDHLKV
jgi:hypothetical protein